MAQRQNDTVVKPTRCVTLEQRQNDRVRHFGTVCHFDTEVHFGTAKKCLSFFFSKFILCFLEKKILIWHKKSGSGSEWHSDKMTQLSNRHGASLRHEGSLWHSNSHSVSIWHSYKMTWCVTLARCVILTRRVTLAQQKNF